MATPQHEGSFLVALPMELLQRITADLDDDHDAILNTRLTCKTLEAATFDCFAEKFFASHQYCVLYRASLLRLYALLASSSRLMSKMRTVTFTSCFFANMTHQHVQVAPTQSRPNLKSAQIAAMKAYSHSQLEMLQTQLLPDATLIREVFLELRAKCPDVEVNLNIRKNATSSISVHVEVLEAVTSLGVALTGLTIDPITLSSGNIGTLQSGLPATASSLVKFSFGSTNIIGAEGEGQVPVSRTFRLLPRVLGSANALRDLTLHFGHPSYRMRTEGLTYKILRTNSYPMLQSLSLCVLAVAEETMMNALDNWAGHLEKIKLSMVHLTDVEGEG